MPNLLKTGAAFLATTMATHASERVQYSRSDASVEVAAVRGRSTFEIDTGDGGLTTVVSHDFIVRVSELELDGVPVTPQIGDVILDGPVGEGEKFEVMGIPGAPPFRWTDEHRNAYRIHTKHVETQLDE